MLNNNTASKLREMKMSAMARSFENQLNSTEMPSLSLRSALDFLLIPSTQQERIIG